MSTSKKSPTLLATGNEQVRPNDAAKHIPIGLIDPNPHQPRHEIAPETLAELTESIQAKGLLEPLVVCLGDGRFVLIAGYRRLTASRLAGLTEAPCIIRDGTDAELLELAILENIQRTDLTPIEEAESYKRLMQVAGIDQKSVAQRVKKAESIISQRLSLLALPKDIFDLLAQGRISIRAALEVGRVSDGKRRERLASKADRLDFEDLQARVQRATEQKRRKKYEKRAAHPAFKDIFAGLPAKRVYKDEVTFVFKDEDEFIAALRKIIKRYDSENWEQEVTLD